MAGFALNNMYHHRLYIFGFIDPKNDRQSGRSRGINERKNHFVSLIMVVQRDYCKSDKMRERNCVTFEFVCHAICSTKRI